MGVWNQDAVFNQVPPVSGAEPVFAASRGINASQTTYQHFVSGVPGGLVVVVVHNEGGGGVTPTSVEGGVLFSEDLTMAVESDSSLVGGLVHVSIWYGIMGGSSSAIRVKYASAPTRSGIGVYYINNYSSSTPYLTGTDDDSGTATASLSVETADRLNRGYAIVAGATSGDQYAHTWSGVTEDYDEQVAGGLTGQTGASIQTTSAGKYTINSTTDGTPSQGTCLAIAAWR